jgi:hypothetical protein
LIVTWRVEYGDGISLIADGGRCHASGHGLARHEAVKRAVRVNDFLEHRPVPQEYSDDDQWAAETAVILFPGLRGKIVEVADVSATR